MRVVAGRHKGRAIMAPPGEEIRPTSDRARESLFNILAHGRLAKPDGTGPLHGAVVLDAFCGTGALALEALSRGAAAAILVDNNPAALAVARANLRALDEEPRASLVLADAVDPPAKRAAQHAATLVFLDPPYRSGLGAPALAALDARGWIAPEAVAVVESEARDSFEPPDGFTLVDERRYGKAKIRFLRKDG
jgi:16S rRNA (guanine966-N2)-methyltransferase